MKQMTITQFMTIYPDDETCLERLLIEQRGGDTFTCEGCGVVDSKFYKLSNRKCYSCVNCRYQVHPTAGTIFHKSATPLRVWFYAIFLFSKSKNGVSAKELQRQLGVTYKCAWRIAKQIRLLFALDHEQLDGTVEMDETYIGGRRRMSQKFSNKSVVVGAVERQGQVVAKVTQDASSTTLQKLLREHVSIGTRLYTDDWRGYTRANALGYNHTSINHSAQVYVQGDVHTNTIEGFWSQLKRSVQGTYHYVSPKYLQSYVNEFAYRYNLRYSDQLFESMLQLAVRRV